MVRSSKIAVRATPAEVERFRVLGGETWLRAQLGAVAAKPNKIHATTAATDDELLFAQWIAASAYPSVRELRLRLATAITKRGRAAMAAFTTNTGNVSLALGRAADLIDERKD